MNRNTELETERVSGSDLVQLSAGLAVDSKRLREVDIVDQKAENSKTDEKERMKPLKKKDGEIGNWKMKKDTLKRQCQVLGSYNSTLQLSLSLSFKK